MEPIETSFVHHIKIDQDEKAMRVLTECVMNEYNLRFRIFLTDFEIVSRS